MDEELALSATALATVDSARVAPKTIVADRYEVLHAIGCGSMGTVYEVEHVRTRARHALKILNGALDASLVERFVVEAQVPSRLATDYVARVTDAGVAPEAGGAPFFVMELLRGVDLERRIHQNGALSPNEVGRLVPQLGHALLAAHALGIVHRDVKPQNLFLHQPFDGLPILKVLDFGIAHVGARSGEGTRPGAMVGTPLYMAPEQASSGGTISQATDIWSVGLVVFTLLTGRPYWVAPTMMHLLSQLLVGTMPRPSSLAPGLPRGFDAWFARSCDRDPSRRFPEVGEQVDALDAVLRGSPGAVAGSSRAPASPAPPATTDVLPAPLTTFVGRDAEVREVCTFVEHARLTSLVGPGGTGKTRLATEVARTRHAAGDTVAFVDLTAVENGERVLDAVADAVAAQRSVDEAPLDAVVRALRRQPTLVVLDNCEHLLAAAAKAVAALAGRAPATRFLCTSRTPLGIVGEAQWRVRPLGLPGGGDVDVATIREAPAVQLFLDRAALVRPTWAPEDDDVRAVGRACARLDGLPLAIELAAAQLETMSIDEFIEAFDRRLESFVTTSATVAPHHRSLHATIDASYARLADDARTLLCWLSVSAGETGVEMAEALGAAAGIEPTHVRRTLADLVRNSLLEPRERRRRTRYGILETIRSYGRSKLEERGETSAAWAALLGWSASLVKEAGPWLEGPDQHLWVERLEAEHDNLRGALHWAGANDVATGLKVSSLAARFWSLRGHLVEGASWCTRFLERSAQAPPLARGRALTALGGLLELRLGRIQEARDRLLEARAILRDQDARSGAWATFYLALAEFDPRDLSRARLLLDESRGAFEREGDVGGVAFATLMWGYTLVTEDTGRARSVAEMVLGPARAARHLNLTGHAIELRICADIASGQHDIDLSSAVEALDGYATLGNRACASHALDVVAFGLLRRGSHDAAATLMGAAEAERRRLSRRAVPYEEPRQLLTFVCSEPLREDSAARATGWAMTLSDAVAYAKRHIG